MVLKQFTFHTLLLFFTVNYKYIKNYTITLEVPMRKILVLSCVLIPTISLAVGGLGLLGFLPEGENRASTNHYHMLREIIEGKREYSPRERLWLKCLDRMIIRDAMEVHPIMQYLFGRHHFECQQPSAQLTSFIMSRDGRFLIGGEKSGKVAIWQTEGRTLLREEQLHKGEVTCIHPCWDNKRCITGSQDGSVKVWDLETGTILWEYKDSDPIMDVGEKLSNKRRELPKAHWSDCLKWLWQVEEPTYYISWIVDKPLSNSDERLQLYLEKVWDLESNCSVGEENLYPWLHRTHMLYRRAAGDIYVDFDRYDGGVFIYKKKARITRLKYPKDCVSLAQVCVDEDGKCVAMVVTDENNIDKVVLYNIAPAHYFFNCSSSNVMELCDRIVIGLERKERIEVSNSHANVLEEMPCRDDLKELIRDHNQTFLEKSAEEDIKRTASLRDEDSRVHPRLRRRAKDNKN